MDGSRVGFGRLANGGRRASGHDQQRASCRAKHRTRSSAIRWRWRFLESLTDGQAAKQPPPPSRPPRRNPANLHLHQCGDIRGSEARRALSPNARSARTARRRTRRFDLEERGAQSGRPASSNDACSSRTGSPETVRSPLALRGAQRLGHLFLKNLLKRAPDKIANRVAPDSSSDLNSANFDPLCIPVMVSSFPIKGMVDSETNGLAMTELR